mgnify:CR=1 FL=1
MSFKDVHWTSVLVGMLLAFALLVGGNWLYQQYFVKSPLGDDLEQRSEIINWSLLEETDKKVLTVELGPVTNLKESYNYIRDKSIQYLGAEGVEIRLVDHRSEKLEQVMYTLQYPIYEALVRGNFTEMAETVKLEAERAQLTGYQVYVDEANLYIHLKHNEDYLYEIIPRATGLESPGTVKNVK